MALLTRKKSKKQQAGDVLVNYLKLKTAGKAAKGTAKGAKKAAKGTAVYGVAKRTPIIKRVPLVVGGIVAAVVATKVVKGHHGGDPAAA
jgi:hypothetical protein